MNQRNSAIAGCVALLVPAYFGLLWSRVPTVICPFPIVTVIPAFILSRLGVLAIVVPSLLFSMWMPGIFRGKKEVPVRSLVLLAALSGLTAWYFRVGWNDGLAYQGGRFTYGVCFVNAAWLAVLWIVFAYAYRKPSFNCTLLAHWLLFAWIGWYAFPYLGELP
jgi:hypothetical protein